MSISTLSVIAHKILSDKTEHVNNKQHDLLYYAQSKHHLMQATSRKDVCTSCSVASIFCLQRARPYLLRLMREIRCRSCETTQSVEKERCKLQLRLPEFRTTASQPELLILAKSRNRFECK